MDDHRAAARTDASGAMNAACADDCVGGRHFRRQRDQKAQQRQTAQSQVFHYKSPFRFKIHVARRLRVALASKEFFLNES
jgi:hypothetical protein